MLLSLFDGDASLFLTLVGLWAIALGGHALHFWTWERANGELLARVRAEEGSRSDPRLVELDVRPANADWIRLWDEACARFLLADQALQRLGTQGMMGRGDLQASMGQVKLLVQGQARLETAMRSLASGELDDRITELKWSIERTEDERLRRIVKGNLDLLEKQRKTVQSLRHDTKRIKATVEGFALAAQNIHLNATRLGATGEQPDQILADSLTALEEEVRVMRLVEAELEGL
jgi:methyl-accepting chemotaxis protein